MVWISLIALGVNASFGRLLELIIVKFSLEGRLFILVKTFVINRISSITFKEVSLSFHSWIHSSS